MTTTDERSDIERLRERLDEAPIKAHNQSCDGAYPGTQCLDDCPMYLPRELAERVEGELRHQTFQRWNNDELLEVERTKTGLLQSKLSTAEAALTELLTEHRILVEATQRYIAAHAGIRARFQDAELAGEYTYAGKALEQLLEPPTNTGEWE